MSHCKKRKGDTDTVRGEVVVEGSETERAGD